MTTRYVRTCLQLAAIGAGLAFTCSRARAQVVPRPAEKDAFVFCIRAKPDGAYVFVRANVHDQYPLPLGKVNEVLRVSRQQFPETLDITIGGERKADGLDSYYGYLPRKVDWPSPYTSTPKGYPPHAAEPPIQAHYFPDIAANPKQDIEPIQMLPAEGWTARRQRLELWVNQNQVAAAGLALLAGLGVFTLIFVVIPAYRTRRERDEADQEWKEKLHDLKTEYDPYLGHDFGGYRLMSRLGAGGMAVVYKGVPEDTRKNEDAVAIKIMNPDVARDVEYRKRFEREIRISKDLNHPNVVRPVTWGENQGVLYFAMEYIQGTLLRDVIPERGFPFPQALEIMLDVCKGVVYAHSQGIVHRDLKPENVMVTQKGLIKVMDLGLAKRNESENVTKTGDTFGTPAYMSPEQITGGGQLTPATDQYALGVMFFELLTGHRPFEVADSLTLVMKHLQEPPPLVRKYKPQLPVEVEALLDRMLAKDPTARYPTLVDVKNQIEKIQQTYVGSSMGRSGERTPPEGGAAARPTVGKTVDQKPTGGGPPGLTPKPGAPTGGAPRPKSEG